MGGQLSVLFTSNVSLFEFKADTKTGYIINKQMNSK